MAASSDGASGILVCVVLGGLNATAALLAGLQTIRLAGRGAPWTTQKVLHVLAALACGARAAFFAVAAGAWNWAAGDLSGAPATARMAFYVSDELPTLVCFTARVVWNSRRDARRGGAR